MAILRNLTFPKNKFGTNNDASWMKEDEEIDEDEDEEEGSLLTFKEPFMMITKLILAKFTLKKKWLLVTDPWTNERTNGQTDGQPHPLIEMCGRL